MDVWEGVTSAVNTIRCSNQGILHEGACQKGAFTRQRIQKEAPGCHEYRIPHARFYNIQRGQFNKWVVLG